MAYSEREEEKNYFLERREVWKQEQKEKGNTVKNKRVVETEPVNYFMDHRKAKEEAARQEIRINQTQQYTPELTDIRKQDRENAGKIAQKFGYGEGNDFTSYRSIPYKSDFSDMVQKGKENDNIFNARYNVLDYLNGKKREVMKGAQYNYTRMTDTEKDLYYYLNGRYGPEAANNYIKSINNQLNQRNTENVMENTVQFGKEHPFAGMAVDAGMSATGSLAFPVIAAKEGYKKLTGQKEQLDPYDPLFGSAIMNEGLRTGIAENDALKRAVPNEGLRNFGVGTAMSMTENLARLPLGYMGLGAAAGSAGLSGTRDALLRGGNTGQALASGAANAAAEAFFEKFSLDNLKTFKLSPGHSVKEFLKNLGKQAVVEGSEEMSTEIANALSDSLIMDELSQYNQAYQAYKAAGKDEASAKSLAFTDFLKNVGLAGLGGAISGGIMGGGSQALGLGMEQAVLNRYGRTIDKDYREYSQGINTDPSSYSRPEDHAEAVNLQQMAQEYADRQRRGEFIRNREKAEYDIRYRQFNENIQNQQPHQQSRGDTTHQKPQEQAEPSETGKNTMESTEARREASAPQETGLFQDQEEVSQAETYRQPYGQYGGEALVNSYDGTVDIAAYNKAFGRAYDAGYHDIDLDTAQRSAIMSVLTNDQMMAAYKAGIHDYNIDNQIVPQYKKGSAREGGLGAVSELASQDQQTVAENVGKMTGLKINLVDDMMEGASASYKPGEITINVNAEDFNGTMAHELTHFIKDQAPEGYEVYKQIIVEAEMKASGRSWEEMMEAYHSRYGEAGQELTRQEVIEEIAADAAQKFLNDPEFIDAVIKKDKNLAQKVIEFLSDVVDALKNLIHAGNLRAAAKNLEENAKFYEEARDLWIYSVHQGGERYKTGEVRENSGTENGNKYQMNQFGFEEYTAQEKNWWKDNSNIILCNSKQDIIDFYKEHVHKKPYARLYIGKVGTELAEKIFKDTGIQTAGLNVAITSEYEDSHSNPEKEKLLGQTPITPEMLADLPEIIAYYDKVEDVTRKKDLKPALKFEKDINGKRVAIEYVRSKKGLLELQTMYAWSDKKNKGVSTTLTMPENSDPYRTSETYSGMAPAETSIQQNEEEINRKNEKFQLDDVDNVENRRIEALLYENQSLREANELLEQQFKLTPKDAVRTEDISKVAKGLLKEYNSQYPAKTLEQNLFKLYEYIRSSENVDGKAVTEAASSIAKSILKKSQQLDRELTEQYRDLRTQIRNTKIAITDQDKADLAAVGGYNEFRKQYFGKMKLGKDGISVDTFYQELQSQYPELFPESVTHPADELIAIASALDQTDAQVKNPYHANMDEMSYILGQDIMQAYFDVRRPQATFADKKEAQLQNMRWKYQQKFKEFKRDMKKQYDDSLKQIQKENMEKGEQLAAQFRNLSEAQQREMKDYYKSRMDKLRDDKLKALEIVQRRNRERLQAMRDLRQRADDKKIILREVNALKNWLLKPTDVKHIPQAMRTIMADFLGNIDFSSNNVESIRSKEWEKAQSAFVEIIKNEGIYQDEKTGNTVIMDVDPDMAQRINDLVKKVRDIEKLDDLDAYNMGELKKVVLSMKKMVQSINDLKSNQRTEKLNVLAEGIVQDLSARKARTEYAGSVSGAADRLVNYDMLDPQTMFGLMGDNMKSVYASLRGGMDKKTVHLKESEEYVKNLMKENDITLKQLRQWTGKKAKATEFQTGGGTLRLTVAGVMSLYEANKRHQAQTHIRSSKGGVKPAPRMVRERFFLKVDKAERAVTLTPADVDSITSSLTPQQKAFADGLQQFMGTQCAAWGNEVSREMYGYDKFTARNYFPIVTDKNFINTKQGDMQNKESTIKNMGMTKSTNLHANNPIIIEDIFEVFTRQVDRMSTYNAYVVPLSDLNKVINYRDAETANSIKEAIERAFGKKGNEYINKLVQDINGSIHTEKGHLDGLLSAWKGSAISGNLRVAIQQPTAYLRAMADISPKYLTMGAMTVTRKGQWNRIAQYAPIAQWKDWGFYKMDTSRRLKDVLFGTDTLAGQINQIAMLPAEAGDKLAWNRLWRACEFEIRDKYKNLEPESEAFYKKVGARFSEIVDRTQVVDSVLHRTQIMRSTNELTKLATSFMAEPLKSYDMLYRAASGVKYGISGAKKAAVGAAAAYVLSNVATALAASVWDSLRDDDREKEFSEKYRENVVDNLLDAAFFINNIPIAKDIVAAIQGETIARSDMQGIQDLYYAIHEIAKSAEGESKYTPQYVAVYAIEHASKITGLPVGNIIREVRTIADTIVNESADLETDYNWIKNKYSMGNKENLNLYVSMMIQARRSGDPDLEQTIKNDLNRAGMDNDTIGGRIKKLIREELITEDSIDPRIDLAVQAMDEGNDTAYMEAVTQLVREGYSQDLVSSVIDLRLKQLRGEEEIDWEAEEKVDPHKLYEKILAAPDEERDLQIEWKSSYSSSDIVQAVKSFTLGDKNSLSAFNEAAENYYQTQRKNGTEKSKAIGNLKRIISTEYKPQWIEAYNTGDRETYEEIQNRLKQLKVDGKYLYSGEDWTSWRKTAKEKAKEE